ncbi:hypothetical protein [Geobacter sp. SVR]|uniref:hypothetical protein n=1 Tax=Geobacter sp. SVR TaxID=2495594 RepID=UPI00143EF4E8|nr:hypothetical protein [Geobacter sp. SVR]BCS55753.1 hypothetical protein GSVR_40610 [Geobacter sp. SVR]GCF83757.1 hypothetical protein GSbR_03570 [Geobacter sp. SVR]
MKPVSFFRTMGTVVLALLLLPGVIGPASAATTLGPLATDFDTYVVSGTQANSNQLGTPYADTAFYPKGGMMISVFRDDPGVGKSARTMETVFSFATAADSTNGQNGLVNGINVVAAFDAQYGTDNWAITSVGISLSSNYATTGVQPNNPDFNTVAPGYFTFNVLAANPAIPSLTWNGLQTFLGSTSYTPVGTFYWPATADLQNQYVTYHLNVTPELVNAIKAGKVTLLGRAADNDVGYLFNTNTKGTPPYLMITAEALAPPAGPVLTLSTLSNGAITNNPTLNVTGTVTDGSGVASLTINGAGVAVNSDGTFSHALTLAAGANTIQTVATGMDGSQTSDTRTITLDQTAPALTIALPADNSIVNTNSVKITGSVADTLAVLVTASVNNGPTANAHISGTDFEVTVNLAPGLNTIEISAVDQAGNSTSVKRSIFADTVVPTLSVTEPAQDIRTTADNIVIRGTVTNATTSATVVVAIEGRTYSPTLAADGSFSQDIALPANKTYAVSVTATDQRGNKATVQRNIIRSTTPYPSGDCNGDGTLDIGDPLLALRIAVGLEEVTSVHLLNADVAPLVNGVPAPDGVIDISDALAILKKVVGLQKW